MNIFRQIAAVTVLSIKSLPSRARPSLVIVVGMACVIGVLVSAMSLDAGYVNAELRAGDPGKAIVLPAAANREGDSTLPHDSIGPILSLPGIRKDSDGSAVAEAEFIYFIRAARKPNGVNFLLLRGIGRKGLELRPELKIVAGRMFRPGARELIVGAAARQQFEHLAVGDKVILQDGEWPVVGTFATAGDIREGEIIGDADTLMAAARHANFNSVTVQLDTPNSFGVLQNALAANPALGAQAERLSDYYRRTSGDTAGLFQAIAFMMGGIMALGALFGSLNTMYSAVAARTQEIGTLRALGFGGLAIAVSVIAEALLLSLTGAVIGIAIAWTLFGGVHYSFASALFNLTVSPGLIGLGIAWALIVALLGGLLPAIRAARLPIVAALRAT
jgi:putative ABC transport system permease protein